MVILLWLIPLLGLTTAYVESLAGSGNVEVLDDRLKKKFEPQVAVKCGYLNQYMLENGHWSPNKDGDATCLTRKEEILSICRKAYPDKDVTNIVESANNVFIENWCQDGVDRRGEECASREWVKPYRCIVGSFQSDALLVPEGCNFSHTYDKRECKEFSFWNQTSQEACALKGLTARSFGVLVPCGIDLFSGVEYVCCPLEMEPMRGDSSERAIEEERSRTRHSPSTATVKPGDDSDNGDNWQDEYLRADDEQTEHEKYENAIQKLEKHHQDRIDKMMKEWTDVSVRYKDLKKTDPQGAKKLKSDLMSRVRKTVAALEEEFNDQKKQLTELHQQRIDVQLNERKRQSMDDFLDAIQERHPKVKKLYNTLEKYIRAEEKDREHTINRYRHLLDNDADSAEQTQPTILGHLSDLDQRINESMKMLNRVPANIAKEVERKARLFWADHRKELFGEGITNDELLKKNKQIGTAERNREQISHQRELEDKFDQLDSADTEEDDLQSEPESETPVMTTARPVIDQDGLNFVPRDRKTPIENVEVFSTPSTTTIDPDDEEDTVEDESAIEAEDAELDKEDNQPDAREKENAGILHKFQDVGSSIAYAKLHREEQSQFSSVQRLVQEDGATASKVLYVGMGLVGVAFLAGLMLLVVVLRRRSPRKEAYSPVDTFASPEERLVANMQTHGYINPFYNHAHQYSKA